MIRLLAAGAAAFALTCGASASAAIHTVTIAGTVSSGFDGVGVFGGGDVSGKAFTANFQYDPVKDVRQDTRYNSEDLSGTQYSGNPPLKVVLDVGDVSYDLGARLAQSLTVSLFSQFARDGSAVCCTFGVDASGDMYSQPTVDDLWFEEDVGSKYFSVDQTFSSYDDGYGFLNLDDHGTYLSFDVTSLSAAPEPDIWALMIAGVSFAGFALRTEKRRRMAHS